MSSLPPPAAVLFAKHPDRLAAFYAAVLDRPAQPQADGTLTLDAGGLTLIVHGIPAFIADDIVITTPPQLREDTPIKLCLSVARIATARERAAALGGQVAGTDREWAAGGIQACDGHDPEGNVFQLRQVLP